MSKKVRIFLITALSLVLIGGLIFVVSMTTLKWDFSALSTQKYQTNTYEITEDFTSITIDTNTADIVFKPSTDSKSTVVCYEQENMLHSVSAKSGNLTIGVLDTREWYEHISLGFNSPKITITIPQGAYDNLIIDNNTGDVCVPKEFTFNSVDIKGDTGDVRISSSVSNDVKVELSTGDIRIDNISAKTVDLETSTGDITVEKLTCDSLFVTVSTGKSLLKEVRCDELTSTGSTGDIKLTDVIATNTLDIERSTGDVIFDESDAGKITVVTDTGDVTGTLLTGKIFVVDTDTGKKALPNTSSGGRCKITTDTGDIIINIKN